MGSAQESGKDPFSLGTLSARPLLFVMAALSNRSTTRPHAVQPNFNRR